MKKRRIILAAVIVLAVIAASMRGGVVVYSLLYTALLFPAVSVAYTLYVYSRFRITQRIDAREAIKNEPVGYLCRMANETPLLFPTIELEFFPGLTGGEERRRVDLASAEHTELRGQLLCSRRGEMRVGVSHVLVHDPLDIIVIPYRVDIVYRVMVYPRILHLDTLGVFDLDGSSVSPFLRPENATAGDTVRAYVRGDDPRLIHWKATARTGRMQVRQLSTMNKPTIVVVVDTRAPEGELGEYAEDCVLETALAICQYAAASGQTIEVHAGDNRFVMTREADMRPFYDWCCHMAFAPAAAAPVLPDLPGLCCAVVTACPDDRLVGAMLELAAAERRMTLVSTGDEREIFGEAGGFRHIHIPYGASVEKALS